METIVGGTLFPLTNIKELSNSSPLELNTVVVTHPTLSYPLYSAYVVVPTLVTNSKGLPHCLEHLVFCGSKSYPQRGLLDRLATLCQSQGTNAWTADDHTCYTFTSSSLEGLKKMLPVFLDHIFNPLLNPETILKEVCGFDEGNNSLSGVVYCEMQSREWSEADQIDGAMRRNIFNSHSPLHHYRWETGGSTGDISTIIPSEIEAYHVKYYRPCNTYLVIIGNSDLEDHSFDFLSKGLSFNTDNAISHTDNNQSQIFNVKQQVTLSPTHKVDVVRFPSEDESMASTALCWKGPRSDDHLNINALHCLLRSLSEGSASPLQQRFVERSDPLSNDIYYDIKASHYTMISLLFQGVPIEHQSCIRDEFHSLMEEFFSTTSTSTTTSIDRIRLSISEWCLKLEEQYENDPHEQIVSYLIPEMISPLFGINSSITNYISNIEGDLSILAEKDIDFWRKLFNEYLSSPEEVWSSPSKEMNLEIKEEEKKHFLAFKEKEQCGTIPSLSQKQQQQQQPESFKGHPLMDEIVIDRPSLRQCIREIQFESSSGLSVNSVEILGEIDGQRVRSLFAFPLIDNLPKELWKYLLIFQESLFQLDISIPETSKIFQLLPGLSCCNDYHPGLIDDDTDNNTGNDTDNNTDNDTDNHTDNDNSSMRTISYQNFQEQMSLKFTKHEVSVGLGNQLFSTGYLGTHLMISMVAKFESDSTTEDLIEILYNCILEIFEFSVWDDGRIGEIVDNLLTTAKENWRDASSVMCALEGKLLENSSPILCGLENSLNLWDQSSLLEEISLNGENVMKDLLNNLRLISKTLTGIKPLLQIGRQRKKIDSENFDYKSSKLLKISEPDKESSFTLDYCLPIFKNGFKDGDGIDGSLNIIPMTDITSSYLSIMVSSNIFSMDEKITENKDSLSLVLFCQLLSFTEGPLYSLLRGKGLCYGASLSLSLWEGSLSLCISESSDPISAILESRALFEKIILEANHIMMDTFSEGMDILNEELLKISKAVDVYSFVTARSSDHALMNTIFRNRLRGFPAFSSLDEIEFQQNMLSITLKDLSKAILRFIPPMMDALNFMEGASLPIFAIPFHKLKDITESCLLSKIPFKISSFKSPLNHL